MEVSDSIPDILQTLSSAPSTKMKKANVFVNELSDMEADLLDLNSPNQDLQVKSLTEEKILYYSFLIEVPGDGNILEKSETNWL